MEVRYLEKIAKMRVVSVPQNQIAAACGLSESRISQITSSDEYKLIEQKIAVTKFEETEMLNQGWDSVEAMGIQKVLTHLQNNPEPDFALRAASLANKAVRRGTHQNNPIAQSAGVRAVIHLNPVFADKLQQNFIVSENKLNQLTEKPKASDFMPASDVHDLLGNGTTGNVYIDVTKPVTGSKIDNTLELPEMERFDNE